MVKRNAIAGYYWAQRPTAELAGMILATGALAGDGIVRELSPCIAAVEPARI